MIIVAYLILFALIVSALGIAFCRKTLPHLFSRLFFIFSVVSLLVLWEMYFTASLYLTAGLGLVFIAAVTAPYFLPKDRESGIMNEQVFASFVLAAAAVFIIAYAVAGSGVFAAYYAAGEIMPDKLAAKEIFEKGALLIMLFGLSFASSAVGLCALIFRED